MFIYEQDELLKFVSACLGISPIYRWADPLACHAYNVMRPEGILPWHFDSCEFTLSIMLQKPDEGVIFEYCPFIIIKGQYSKITPSSGFCNMMLSVNSQLSKCQGRIPSGLITLYAWQANGSAHL